MPASRHVLQIPPALPASPSGWGQLYGSAPSLAVAELALKHPPRVADATLPQVANIGFTGNEGDRHTVTDPRNAILSVQDHYFRL